MDNVLGKVPVPFTFPLRIHIALYTQQIVSKQIIITESSMQSSSNMSPIQISNQICKDQQPSQALFIFQHGWTLHHEQPLNPGKLAGLSNPGPELLTKIKLTVLQFHYPTHTFICFSLWTIFCPLSGLGRPHAHSQPFILLLQLIAKCCSALRCLKTGFPEDVPQLQEPSRVSFYTPHFPLSLSAFIFHIHLKTHF